MVIDAPIRLRFLDPTAGPVEGPTAMAPGVEDLSGLRIGMLSNSKAGAREFLGALADAIEERYRGVTFVRARKGDASSVCPPDILADLVAKTDVVITAVGD